MIEYVEAFHKAFGDSPRLFILTFTLIGAFIGAGVLGGLAYVVDRGYQKSKPKDTTNGPVTNTITTAVRDQPKPILREQALEIVSKIVDRYKKKHNGHDPTVAWVNQRLKGQGQTFTVSVPNPKPAGTQITIIGGSYENNGAIVRNYDPNARVTLSGTTGKGNKDIVVNLPTQPEQKIDKPKQP